MESGQEFKLEYSLTFRDLIALRNHYFWIKLQYLALLPVVSMLLIGPYLICIALNSLGVDLAWPQAFVVFEMMLVPNEHVFSLLIQAIIFPILFLLIFFVVSWRSYKCNQFLFKNISVVLTPEAIYSKTQTVESKFDWSAVLKVTRSKSLFMFQFTKTPPMVLTIPKHAFDSEEQAEAFYQFACQQWKSRSPR